MDCQEDLMSKFVLQLSDQQHSILLLARSHLRERQMSSSGQF
jgi:hypothetical protein